MADWDWVYELIEQKYEPQPELPEDCLFILLKKNPLLQDLIDKYSLQMEL